jgi:TRAP-type C4-dicarboxylate transport system permease small subunit
MENIRKPKGAFSLLQKVDSALARAFGAVTSWLFVIMLLMMLVQVFARFVIQVSIPWSQEVIIWLFTIVAFLGAAVAIKENSHIEIDILAVLLNKISDPEHRASAERLNDIVRYLLIFILCVVLSYLCWKFMLKVKKIGYLTPGMGLPKWWIDAAVLLGLVLMSAHAFIKLVFSLFGIPTKETCTPAAEAGAEEVAKQ